MKIKSSKLSYWFALTLIGFGLAGCSDAPPEPPALDATAMEEIERADAKIADEESGL